MKAAVVSRYDAPPRYADFGEPVAGDVEVLVDVSAAGFHRIVKALASGSHYGSTGVLPMIPGVDGVGRLGDGTRVYFGRVRDTFGTMAERCVTTRSMCMELPDNLDDVTVAAMMNPGMSSWAALRERVDFKAGESVLILGATGIAGQLAVQIAKRMGARRVAAAGRNEAALKELEQLGADVVIPLGEERGTVVNMLREEIKEQKTDVVLDYVWSSPAEMVLEAIGERGLSHAARRIRYVQIGNSAGPTITMPAATLRSTGLELVGSGFGSVSMERIFASLAEFMKEAAREPFEFNAKSVPLSEVESVWNAPDGGERLVFRP
jgi:NADPH2:quinone reductase